MVISNFLIKFTIEFCVIDGSSAQWTISALGLAQTNQTDLTKHMLARVNLLRPMYPVQAN